MDPVKIANQIVGELITHEKYRLVNMAIISEVVHDTIRLINEENSKKHPEGPSFEDGV